VVSCFRGAFVAFVAFVVAFVIAIAIAIAA
jgi:hypothetical protein